MLTIHLEYILIWWPSVLVNHKIAIEWKRNGDPCVLSTLPKCSGRPHRNCRKLNCRPTFILISQIWQLISNVRCHYSRGQSKSTFPSNERRRDTDDQLYWAEKIHNDRLFSRTPTSTTYFSFKYHFFTLVAELTTWRLGSKYIYMILL